MSSPFCPPIMVTTASGRNSTYNYVYTRVIVSDVTCVESRPIWVPMIAITAGSRTLRLAIENMKRIRWNSGRFHSHSSCRHSACMGRKSVWQCQIGVQDIRRSAAAGKAAGSACLSQLTLQFQGR